MKLVEIIALLLFSYVRVYDEQGKLVGREQIVSGNSVLNLRGLETEDIANLEIRVDKRGLRKLIGDKLTIDADDKVAEISFTEVDILKPLVITDLEQCFIASAQKEDISQCYNHEMIFLSDEQWIRDGQEYFHNLMLGKA